MHRNFATYSDQGGSEEIEFANDGSTLRIWLRGVEFSGTDFDSLEPVAGSPPDLLKQSLSHGSLCAFALNCQMPVMVVDRARQVEGRLQVELVLGSPTANGGLDREDLHLAMEVGGHQFVGPGKSGWFEDELLAIQAQMPEGTFIKACINCLYSDYSPAGHGLFGSMMCFRNIKSDYLKVETKDHFWPIHNRFDRLVQETYLCPEFERRVKGTGYRG